MTDVVIDKWKLFERLGYKVYHPEVERFHNSTAKTKVCAAPSRTTKSYSAAKDVLPDILKPGTMGWIVGPNYTLAEKEFRYIHQDLVINRDRLGLPKPRVCLTNARSGSLYIEFPWGSIVEGKSADSPVSLLGEAVDWVIYSEAAQLPRGIRERYVQQRLITRNGREIVPTTPFTTGEWVQEEIEKFGHNPDFPEVEAFTWDVTANPEYSMADFNLAKRKYGEDSAMFREQYLGEWVFYAGLIYNNIDPKIHIIEPFDIPKSWPVVRAVDFGARDPFVCLLFAVGPNAELYQFAEYYNRESAPIRVHAANIKEMSRGYNIIDSVGDPAAKQSIEDLCYEGVMCSPADNERAAGRMRVMEYLMPTDEAAPPFQNAPDNPSGKWPRLFTFSNQHETIREQKFYRWKERKSVKSEMDREQTEGEDHCLHPDTKVITDKGKVRIKDLVGKEGKVLSRDGKWENFRHARMTMKDQPIVEVKFDNGDSVKCTKDHKFLTPDGWVEAVDMIGKSCCTVVQKSVVEKCVEVSPAGKSDVYCLEVPATHALAVESGILTHNSMDCRRYGVFTRPSPFEIRHNLAKGSFSYEMDKMIGSQTKTGFMGYGKAV